MNREIDEQLASEFSQDPLYKLIVRMEAVEELFDDYIMGLKPAVEYSTTDIENWYCSDELKPATMRSWIKALEEYIEIQTIGNRGIIRLDYRAVFRIRMALMLREKNVKLQRVCQYVGIRPIEPEIVGTNRNEKHLAIPERENNKEAEVTRNIIGQMLATGMIEINDGMPVLRIKEYIQEEFQHLQQKLLPDQDAQEKQFNDHLELFKEELKQALPPAKDPAAERQQRITDRITERRIISQLEIEALEEWGKLPTEQRTKKVGLFRREEKVLDRERFIRKYVEQHFASRYEQELES